MSDWITTYAGYDDQALAMLANPGLVRRAAKLLPEVAALVLDGDSGAIEVSGFSVQLDARGPAAGRCPCPVAGICVHVLAAAMAVRASVMQSVEVAPDVAGITAETPEVRTGTPSESVTLAAVAEQSQAAETVTASEASPALAELLALTQAALFRKAGIAAVRQAYARMDEAEVTVVAQQRFVDIGWAGQQVRYVGGAGFDGMVSTAQVSTRKALHLEALARVFRSFGRVWGWPDAVGDGLNVAASGSTPATKALLAEVNDEVTGCIGGGLSHVSTSAMSRFAELALDARLAGLPQLGRMLGAAATLLEGLAKHDDDISEFEVTGALAKVWALLAALDTADVDMWEKLRGRGRRDFSSMDAPASLTLLPLGATWWVADSGARGVTLWAWDVADGVLRPVTSARPHGVDPSFGRQRGLMAFWGAAISTLLGGFVEVTQPRFAADGTLSATASAVSRTGEAFQQATLHQVADVLTQTQSDSPGFGGVEQQLRLVEVTGFGKLVIDEPSQQLVWSLQLADGTCQLRQVVTAATTHRVEALLGLEADRVKVDFVLARQQIVHGQALWEPVSLFLREKKGLRLFSLDFSRPVDGWSVRSALQKRWVLLLSRWGKAPTVPNLARSAIAIACDDARELTVALTATGRMRLTGEQHRRCENLISRLDDMALATLANTARAFASHPDVATALRLHHLADRTATLAAVAQ
ncbi:MAG: hypothetical protein FWG47_01150 [Propionibacteriaceae bacterium]|nr:hypothetical protein [Propionibacteriaceae bacterium]